MIKKDKKRIFFKNLDQIYKWLNQRKYIYNTWSGNTYRLNNGVFQFKNRNKDWEGALPPLLLEIGRFYKEV